MSTKSEVMKMQQQLNSMGANLKVDGIWGPKTQSAYDRIIMPHGAGPYPLQSVPRQGTGATGGYQATPYKENTTSMGSYGYAYATAPNNQQVSTAFAKPTPMHDKYISKGIQMPTKEVLDNREEFFGENNRHKMPKGNSLGDYMSIFQYGNNPYMRYVDNLPGNLKAGEEPGGGSDAFWEIFKAVYLDTYQKDAFRILLEKNNKDFTNRVIQDMRSSSPEEAFRKYVMAGKAGGRLGYGLQGDKIPDNIRDTRGTQQPLSTMPSNARGQEAQGVVEKHGSVPGAMAGPQNVSSASGVTIGKTSSSNGTDTLRSGKNLSPGQQRYIRSLNLQRDKQKAIIESIPKTQRFFSDLGIAPNKDYIAAKQRVDWIDAKIDNTYATMEVIGPTPSPSPIPTPSSTPYPTVTPSPQSTATPKPAAPGTPTEHFEQLTGSSLQRAYNSITNEADIPAQGDYMKTLQKMYELPTAEILARMLIGEAGDKDLTQDRINICHVLINRMLDEEQFNTATWDNTNDWDFGSAVANNKTLKRLLFGDNEFHAINPFYYSKSKGKDYKKDEYYEDAVKSHSAYTLSKHLQGSGGREVWDEAKYMAVVLDGMFQEYPIRSAVYDQFGNGVNHDWQRMADEYHNLFDRLLGELNPKFVGREKTIEKYENFFWANENGKILYERREAPKKR